MKKLGILCICASIFIGLIIDCNLVRNNIVITMVISWIVFLLGIYILILCDNKVIK